MSKNYYKIDVMGGDGYSFMVCTSETNEDAVIELAKECFSDPSDIDRASIDPLIDEDDIKHFKSGGCLYDLDGDDDPVPAEQKECQESVATIELKKVDPCDNDLLLSILEVKNLMLVFIGSIVCNNTKAEILGEDGDEGRAFNTLMFDRPQKYGDIELHGLTVNTDDGSCEDCIPDIDFLTDSEGVRSIPSDNMGVETICELCVDIAESFGMGDSMKGMFGEVFGNGEEESEP